MASVTLPAVRASPTSLQYALTPRSGHARPLYPVKFYPNSKIKETLALPWLAATDPLMPKYPYKTNPHFQEANHGLYGGQEIQSGHKISKGRNKGKTLRKWYPNVRSEVLESEALGTQLTLPVTARTMRTIRKSGGLDQYLLKDKPARLKELGLLGWKLRWLVLKSQTIKEQHAAERKRLGLPAAEQNEFSPENTFEHVWHDANSRSKILQKMTQNWDVLLEKKQKIDKTRDSTFVRQDTPPSSLDRLETLHPRDISEQLAVKVTEEEVPVEERIRLPKAEVRQRIRKLKALARAKDRAQAQARGSATKSATPRNKSSQGLTWEKIVQPFSQPVLQPPTVAKPTTQVSV